jgi:hypothetical protein
LLHGERVREYGPHCTSSQATYDAVGGLKVGFAIHEMYVQQK